MAQAVIEHITSAPRFIPVIGDAMEPALPAALPAGEYWFIQRTLYDCSWLFGLASRKIGYQTDPARVVIR